MKNHIAYLKYVLKHKWHVLAACPETKTSLWRGLFHDWTKFLPSEWKDYVYTFYAEDGSKRYKENRGFYYAWNSHQKRNKHHWQYWLLKMDNGTLFPLEMPVKYVNEMLADWIGAGLAITGKRETKQWYERNKNKMILHERTRKYVERFLNVEARKESLIIGKDFPNAHRFDLPEHERKISRKSLEHLREACTLCKTGKYKKGEVK